MGDTNLRRPLLLARANRVKILVLEDDPLVARGLTRVLGLMGHEVVLARAVEDAKSLSNAHGDLSIAMADLGLPGGESGLDFLNWLKASRAGVRRILLTGMSSTAGFENDPPRQTVLFKPFDRSRLQAAIDELTKHMEAS
jgi:DNA-binding NtrC family response regulator